MKTVSIAVALALVYFGILASKAQAVDPKIKVLIVDGQNNHQWATTTPLLKTILEETGVFTVEVSTAPPGPARAPRLPNNATPEQTAKYAEAVQALKASEATRKASVAELRAKWRPRFSDYQVVVSNYNGEDWPEEVRTTFIAFVKNGGGFVSYHAANNAFPTWPEYNELIGVGGWGGRTPKSGPYLRLRNNAWITEQVNGPSGGHGSQSEFLVETYAPEHPILKGLPTKWMHAQDELYHALRGPAKEMTVLGAALSEATKEYEPMLMVRNYGKGRVFHTTLGHFVDALHGLGFQLTFARGVEWAATGKVTQPTPAPGTLSEGPKAALRPLSERKVK
jgi:uncharacterized protein